MRIRDDVEDLYNAGHGAAEIHRILTRHKMNPPSLSTIQRIVREIKHEQEVRLQRNIDRAWSPVYV